MSRRRKPHRPETKEPSEADHIIRIQRSDSALELSVEDFDLLRDLNLARRTDPLADAIPEERAAIEQKLREIVRRHSETGPPDHLGLVIRIGQQLADRAKPTVVSLPKTETQSHTAHSADYTMVRWYCFASVETGACLPAAGRGGGRPR
jgi:hypothetical protein